MLQYVQFVLPECGCCSMALWRCHIGAGLLQCEAKLSRMYAVGAGEPAVGHHGPKGRWRHGVSPAGKRASAREAPVNPAHRLPLHPGCVAIPCNLALSLINKHSIAAVLCAGLRACIPAANAICR